MADSGLCRGSLKNGLRVCFIGSFPPSRGRLAEYSYNLINELCRLQEIGHIDVLAEEEHSFDNEKTDSCRKIRVHRAWKVRNPVSLLLVPLKVLILNPDIVHFNVHFAVFGKSRFVNFLGLSLPLICRFLGFKTLVTLHNVVDRIDLQKTGIADTFLNRLGTIITTKILSHNSSLVVTMKSYIKILEERYKCKKLAWIPHGTWDVNPVIQANHNPQTILYFGHSGPYKDLDLLFKAFEIVNNRKSATRLIVAGSSHPSYPDFLDRYERTSDCQRIQFTGYVPEDHFPDFFRHIDLAVLPYHTCTGTSGVAHLVSSYGIPIVATDLPEFRELVAEGCRMILSSHNPSSLAEKIESVLNSRDLMISLRDQGLMFARERTWGKVAVLFNSLYQEIIEVDRSSREEIAEPYDQFASGTDPGELSLKSGWAMMKTSFLRLAKNVVLKK